MDFTIARVLVWQMVTGAGLGAVLWGVFGLVAATRRCLAAWLVSYECISRNAIAAAPPGPGREGAVAGRLDGELGKLALTVLIFSLVFTLVRPLNAAALFAGFIATQLVTFSGFLMRDKEQQETDTKDGS